MNVRIEQELNFVVDSTTADYRAAVVGLNEGLFRLDIARLASVEDRNS